jgi:hypothetical protein
MTDGVPSKSGWLEENGAEPGSRDAREIAAELDRLIREAEAGRHETLAYLIRMALYEARRLEGERDTFG